MRSGRLSEPSHHGWIFRKLEMKIKFKLWGNYILYIENLLGFKLVTINGNREWQFGQSTEFGGW